MDTKLDVEYENREGNILYDESGVSRVELKMELPIYVNHYKKQKMN